MKKLYLIFAMLVLSSCTKESNCKCVKATYKAVKYSEGGNNVYSANKFYLMIIKEEYVDCQEEVDLGIDANGNTFSVKCNN